MSLVFVGTGDNGIVFTCDGVATEPETGNVLFYASKLILFPEISCVMGFTGMGRAGRLFSAAIEGRYMDFDDVIRRAENDLEEFHTEFVAHIGAEDLSNEMCVAIGGFSSERKRFEAYRIMSYQKGTSGAEGAGTDILEAWKLHPIQGYWASQAPHEEHLAEFDPYGTNDMVAAGIRMVCAGRAGCAFDDVPIPGIGGFVQVAVLSEDGIQSWIAHRWPDDVIGRPIDPTKGDRMPRHLIPLAEPEVAGGDAV